jgi:hypothetical protein
MPASRSVVSVLVRALGDFSLHPQGRPCGRPPAALRPAAARRASPLLGASCGYDQHARSISPLSVALSHVRIRRRKSWILWHLAVRTNLRRSAIPSQAKERRLRSTLRSHKMISSWERAPGEGAAGLLKEGLDGGREPNPS